MAVKQRLNAVVLFGGLLIGQCAGEPVGAQEPQAMLEELTYDLSDISAEIFVRTSTPVPGFRCRLSIPGSAGIALELPHVVSRLGERYVLASPLVPEIRVERGRLNGGDGVRVLFIPGTGSLESVMQVGQGIVLRFEAATARPVTAEALGGGEYRIGPGDKLEIAVLGHPDLSKVVEVRVDGSINVPLLGDVPVAGKTAGEVESDIAQRLKRDYLVDPEVSVDIRDYQSQWVTAIGEVRTPGRYVLKRDMRLIDLLAEAGGTTKESGPEIIITRRVPGQEEPQQIPVDREALFGHDAARKGNIPLVHGDIIAVPEKEAFYIRGEVVRPGSYFLERGMTVMQAITVAGGLGQFANRKSIQLLRSAKGGKSEKMIINLKAIEDGKRADVSIQPNDLIIVPRRIL